MLTQGAWHSASMTIQRDKSRPSANVRPDAFTEWAMPRQCRRRLGCAYRAQARGTPFILGFRRDRGLTSPVPHIPNRRFAIPSINIPSRTVRPYLSGFSIRSQKDSLGVTCKSAMVPSFSRVPASSIPEDVSIIPQLTHLGNSRREVPGTRRQFECCREVPGTRRQGRASLEPQTAPSPRYG